MILILMSFGLAATFTCTLFEVLQRSVHSIKTGFGVLMPLYGNETPPLQRTGQGNGLAPTFFPLLSCKIFCCMEHFCHGIILLTIITRFLLTIISFAFVDDADLVDGAQSVHTCGEDLIAGSQAVLSRWCGLLWTTGGLIVPLKSKWWLIDFKWNAEDFVYCKKNDMQGNFFVPDLQGNLVFIEQLDVSTAVESLGVWITMNGNQAQQKESLLAQSTKFAAQMRSSSCSKTEALYTYSSSFLKSLEYPMEVTRFSKKEWNSIVWPALSASLHAAGMEARFPHTVLYGP